MNVLIIGAGFTGQQLARRLISSGHDVTVVDDDADAVGYASNRLDAQVVLGNATDLDLLEEAGLAKAKAVVTLTESDEVNMMICSLVSSLYPKILTIARVRNPSYYNNTARFLRDGRSPYGITRMVHPDKEAAAAVLLAIEHGAQASSIDFDDSDYVLTTIQIEENSALVGTKVCDMHTIAPKNFLLAFIQSGDKSFLPTGNTVLNCGDVVAVLSEKDDAAKFLSLAGSMKSTIHNVLIIGANKIGANIIHSLGTERKLNFLSRFMQRKRSSLKKFVIVEEDKALIKQLSEQFSANDDLRFFNADITDESFVEEEHLADFDLVIAATTNYEQNIVTAAYLKSMGVKKAICLVVAGRHMPIARKIGIDVPIPVRDTVVDCIMSHLSGHNVTEIHTLFDGKQEVIELQLNDKSPYVGKSLKEIGTTGEFLVLMIHNGEKYEIARGDSVLNPGTKLILMVDSEDSKKILAQFGK